MHSKKKLCLQNGAFGDILLLLYISLDNHLFSNQFLLSVSYTLPGQ